MCLNVPSSVVSTAILRTLIDQYVSRLYDLDSKGIECVLLINIIADLTIGFTGAPYRAMENMGPMIFTVAVNVIGNAMLATDVVVSFSTEDGSTSGK